MSFLIIGKYRVIIAAMIVFSIRITMPAYAQMPKDAGSDLMEQLSTTADSGKDAQKKEAGPLADEPVMKIKRLDNEGQVYSFELKDAEIKDIFRVLAYDYKLNLLVDNEVEGKMTATMTNVSLDQFLEAAAELLNLTIEKSGSFIKVKPNLITKIFVLKYIEAQIVLSFGGSAEMTGKGHIIYDLLSKKGKIFLGRQPNSIMVIDYPPNIKKIGDYLEGTDRRVFSQIFKLKYLKASDIVGVENNTPAGAVSSASEGSETSSSAGNYTNTGG